MRLLLGSMVLLFSFGASAAYQCTFKLFHTEDLYSQIAERTVTVGDSDMKTIHVDNFFIEKEKGRKSEALTLKMFMDGWKGEEEMAANVFRKYSRRSTSEIVRISERVSLRGNAQDTLWFDTYKLDVTCSLDQNQ